MPRLSADCDAILQHRAFVANHIFKFAPRTDFCTGEQQTALQRTAKSDRCVGKADAVSYIFRMQTMHNGQVQICVQISARRVGNCVKTAVRQSTDAKRGKLRCKQVEKFFVTVAALKQRREDFTPQEHAAEKAVALTDAIPHN